MPPLGRDMLTLRRPSVENAAAKDGDDGTHDA